MKVRRVSKVKHSGTVFNIETKKQHNYFANGILVHNCYQGSTTKGKHAETSFIANIAGILGELGVFEVALGGGEPTMHPDFLKILNNFAEQGVVPNFTTRNFDLLKDPAQLQPIMEVAGAVAYSVTSSDEARAYAALVGKYPTSYYHVGKPNRKQFKAHLVMGSMPMDSIIACASILAKEHIDTVLLGFKRTGRGMEFPAHSYHGWIDALQSANINRMGIDTALALEYEEPLRNLGQAAMFHVQEGAYSAYIEAVTKQIAPSSYCEKTEYKELCQHGYGWPSKGMLTAAYAAFPAAKSWPQSANEAE